METYQVTLTEEQRKLLIKLLQDHTPAYDGSATGLLNRLKDLKGED